MKNMRDDVIRQARETDILEYFRASGYQIERHGSEYYISQIPGLCIKPDTNQWYHHYIGAGATNNSIDCLIRVLDKDFSQAVYELTGRDISMMRSSEHKKSEKPFITSASERPIITAKKELIMPERAPTNNQLFAYLCKTRGIPAAIVRELLDVHLLYQSVNTVHTMCNGTERTFHNANAVFVHMDREGKAIGAEIQGCNSKKRYKSVAPGTSASAFLFTPVPSKDGKPHRAFIFESAIDLLSFYTFCEERKKLTGSMLLSMAGLKPTVPKQLQAEGIEIISCVDNDDAGRRFEHDNGFQRSEFVRSKLDALGYKDWNEKLIFGAKHPDAPLLSEHQVQQQEHKTIFARGTRS